MDEFQGEEGLSTNEGIGSGEDQPLIVQLLFHVVSFFLSNEGNDLNYMGFSPG